MSCCLVLGVGSGVGGRARGLGASLRGDEHELQRAVMRAALSSRLHPTPLNCAPQTCESYLREPVGKLLSMTGNKEVELTASQSSGGPTGWSLVQESSCQDKDFRLRTGIYIKNKKKMEITELKMQWLELKAQQLGLRADCTE